LTNAPTWVSAGIAETAEAVGALGATSYTLDFQNVDDVVMYVGGVATRGYTVTVEGAVEFAVITGGAVTADYNYYMVSQTGGFFKWELTIASDVVDSTVFRSPSAWKENAAILKSWEATATRHWIHPGFTREIGEKMIVKFFEGEATDRRWEGWGNLANAVNTVQVDTLIDEEINFTGNDIVSHEV